jgi:glycosyltransferase involved in cell wall biosynthesis
VHVRLLIAIPVHNERKYVRQVLAKVHQYHKGDILVIDDGSKDGTAEILAGLPQILRIRHATNMGYGQSLIDAFDFAERRGYDWVITMDCDEQHEPEMIPEFERQIRTDQWDLISGSRYLNQRSDDDLPPGDRRKINGQITRLVNDTLNLNLTDTFCGYKAHRVEAMRRITLDVTGYAFPMQLWPQVAAANFRISELPVRLIYNDPTRHFGGQLDDADNRLRHYLEVFHREMKRAFGPEARDAEELCCCAE